MTAGLTAAYPDPVRAAPGSVDGLLTRTAQVALDLSGAGQSAWNGEVFATTGSILGLANWDGTLFLDRECILDPLEQMYEHAGEHQPTPTLASYRAALATLLHEHAHFLGPAGASQDDAREAFLQPGSRQLEEGVAEAWTQDHLDEYLLRLDLDKVAPGIKDVEIGGYYPAFVPAVRTITTDLELRNDLTPGQILDALNRETAAGQFPLLVSLIYNSTHLPDLEPAGTPTRAHLESTLRQALSHLDTYELTSPTEAATGSHSTATALLQDLHNTIQSAESTHQPPHPSACALPPPTRVPEDEPSESVTSSGLTSPPPVHAEERLTPTPLQTAFAGVSPPRPQSASAKAARTAGDARHVPRGAPPAAARQALGQLPRRM